MKALLAVLMMAFTIAILSSCKKDKTESPGIRGYWQGKYGNGASAYPTLPYFFLFRNDGTVRIYANVADTATASKAEGTYTVSGSTVTTTYTYLTVSQQYSTTATVDSRFTFIEGTWGNGTNTTNGGRFFLNKQ